jgi:hypothetical protein
MLRNVIYGKGCYGFSQLMLPHVSAASACFFLYRRLYSYQGIPLPVVRHLARQTLAALNFLHTKCQITHLGEPLVAACQPSASQQCVWDQPLPPGFGVGCLGDAPDAAAAALGIS